jgi:hypothetical protein
MAHSNRKKRMLGVLAQLVGPMATIPPAPAVRRSLRWRSASAAQPGRSLLPVRPGVGTDDAAPGATMRGPNVGTGT